MATRIKIRSGTIAGASTNNPILSLGEIGVITDFASDSQRIKIGDGVTAWNSLPFFNPAGGGGGAVWGGITGTLSSQTDLQNALNAKYDASNPSGFITASALSPYLTSVSAALTYVALAGSYADPSWITSLAYSKISGAPSLAFLPLAGGTMLGTLDMSDNPIVSGNNSIKTEIAQLQVSNVAYLDWLNRRLLGGSWGIESALQILDTTYKTAISAASSVLGFGTTGSEFTSFDFGNASTRNGLRISGAASGSAVSTEAQGVDANIDYNIATKGTGAINIQSQTINIGTSTNPIIQPTTSSTAIQFRTGNNAALNMRLVRNGSMTSNSGIFSQISVEGTYAPTGTGAGSITWISFIGTINQTGTANQVVTGIDYNPTVTAILGSHYGIRVRPTSALSGFGLGASAPTSLVHIGASTTTRASLRLDSGVAPTSPNNGDIWNDGTDLKVRLGGVTYTLVKL